MKISIVTANLADINPMRSLFLHEINCQFICNKCHDYGWADTYHFIVDDVTAGYGAVWGTDRREDRDTIFEFYLLPFYRKYVNLVFARFANLTKAVYVECQTNDVFLTQMLYRFCNTIKAEAALFNDGSSTHIMGPGLELRKVSGGSNPADFAYELTENGIQVASGGLLVNYNHPYADIYMEVNEKFRRRGLGSYLVQQLKKEAYAMNKVPAARCNIHNDISKATLEKAGMAVCGYRLKGDILPVEQVS
ncbi:GNAT family N-acetyltransferase [Foetidibacter luteolus]|uniref:GNAT family N-acetyltransferase n=1 Tax=Foetidibacter luteolus TaxID=2608880 RepID=UPI00129B2E69|nr:GNAT family N-acetyltransferase [Foetidibacter luteolus]